MGKRLRRAALACALAFGVMAALAGCSGETYQPELKSATVSTPTIGEAGTLRVGVNADKAPLAGTSDGGKIVGIDVDIAARIADELGLSVTIVDVGSDPEDALTNGEVDIVMGVDKSSDAGDMWLSDAYLPTGISLFTLASGNTTAPTTVPNSSVGAQISSTSSWATTNEFGDAALKQYTKLSDAFSALDSGEVDYVAADALIGAYAAHRQDVDVAIVGLMSSQSGYCVGVSKTNTELQSTIADVLGSLVDGGVIDVVEMKWMGSALDLSGVARISGALANAAEDNADDTEHGGDSAGDEANVESEGEAAANASNAATASNASSGASGASSSSAAAA